MKELIGNSLLSKLKPKEKAYDIWDSKLTGFILRVLPTGTMVYRCEYARGKRITIGKSSVVTPAQARDIAKEILSQTVLGIEPSKKSREQMTLEQFVTCEYEVWRVTNRKDGISDIKRLKVNFVREFGDRLLSEISTLLIEKWRTQRISHGICSATVNRDIVILKSALSKALEWGLIKEHPLKALKLHKIDSTGKLRYLHGDEERRLEAALHRRNEEIKTARLSANTWREVRGYETLPVLNELVFADHLTPMVLISLNTGLRQGELFHLQWNDINFDQAFLTIKGDTAKSGKTRHIPLNAIALKTFITWRNNNPDGVLIFPNPKTNKPFDNVAKAWKGILKSAEIENFRWHDMRHHFASKLVMNGVDLNTVRELLGHADIKMTLRYAHLAPEHKANAVERLVKRDMHSINLATL